MIKSNVTFLVLLLIGLTTCTYTEKIRTGDQAFERKQYAVAAEMLQKEYAKAKSRIIKGKIAYKIAESYVEMNQLEQSINWFNIAYNNQLLRLFIIYSFINNF